MSTQSQSSQSRKGLKAFKAFFEMESSGGILLMLAAVVALFMANSSLAHLYDAFLSTKLSVMVGGVGLNKNVSHWINDGMMAIFFLLVGMEIKREVIEGELASIQQAALPAIAAAGGVALPAIIYTVLNTGGGAALHGWAIPTATDIAFAIGVLALFGSRVPLSLKVFLTAVAVIDDLIAILIIALFYTSELSTQALGVAALALVALFALNRANVQRPALYILVGLVMWVAVLKSGVHATIAGVLLGLMIPHRSGAGHTETLLKRLEHALHPWVAYLILPVFAFANSGIHFDGITRDDFLGPVPIGIALGLFFGKQIGIFTISYLAIKAGIARMPSNANWKQFYGVCILCGIGFTMSLFIGSLSFDSAELGTQTRIGVMGGSIASALLGCFYLSRVLPKKVRVS